MDCSLSRGSTGGGTILSFVPETEIVLSAMALTQFHAGGANARFFSLSRGGILPSCG
jgi:hypothetical protein